MRRKGKGKEKNEKEKGEEPQKINENVRKSVKKVSNIFQRCAKYVSRMHP